MENQSMDRFSNPLGFDYRIIIDWPDTAQVDHRLHAIFTNDSRRMQIMKSIKLLVLTAILACASRAAAVTITITGTVHSGIDGNPASSNIGANDITTDFKTLLASPLPHLP
jgi:hypothetical protein